MPRSQAPVANIITERRAEHRAAWPLSEFEKSAHENMLCATELFMYVIKTVPRKLHTAAKQTAFFIDSVPLQTQLVMALGASVHPFTKITPSVRSTDIISAGESMVLLKKSKKEKFINLLVLPDLPCLKSSEIQ